MSNLRTFIVIGLILCAIAWSGTAAISAQEPRPTPTMDPGATPTSEPDPTTAPDPTPEPQSTPTPDPENRPTPTAEASGPGVQPAGSGKMGTIQGMVYEDLDGDGQCFQTGEAGEGPLANINMEFVSSDEKTVINLQTDENGVYGLAAAGYSYWAVSPQPDASWVVASEETLYVPIFADSLAATDVNFCLLKASSAQVLLPESGSSFPAAILTGSLAIGLMLLLAGMGLIRAGTSPIISYKTADQERPVGLRPPAFFYCGYILFIS